MLSKLLFDSLACSWASCDAICRHLLAMSVAQAEAVLAAAASQPASADGAVTAVLLGAVRHAPCALASSPPVRQALQLLVERLGVADEVSLQRWHYHLAGSALR